MNASDENNNSDFTFQAEVDQLLKMMVHSVYTEKEIFLRELISNASDACDKLRYEAVTNADLVEGELDLKISIAPDKDNKTLTITDNGIGMDRQDLIDNLGTIARSGTKAFLEQMSAEKEKSGLIGQFGVGFYSSFMVADKVEVISAKAGDPARHIWSSDGSSGFHIEATEDYPEIARGTKIILHLNEDAQKFLDEAEIRNIVRTYSDHISFPIVLLPEGKEGAKEGSEEEAEEQQLNTASALWTRPKSEISEEDYQSFYRDTAGQFDEPKITIHYKAEGRHEYSVLLFVPSSPPFNLFNQERKGNIKLYVRRVFITSEAEIVPAYLRFVRGVIDSEDMPLNISREMLQNNPIVASIRKAVTKRILTELTKFKEKDADGYQEIWEAFGSVLKEGIYEDPERRDQLFELALFRSTNQDGWVSLKTYLENKQENQTAIYYLTGDSIDQLKASPKLEGFRARGIDVLLLTDPVDNFWVTTATGFDGKPFTSISQGEADLSNIKAEEKEGEDKSAESDSPSEALIATLIAKLKTVLEKSVSDVRISERLVDSPACLVAPADGPDRGLEKILGEQAQAMGQGLGQGGLGMSLSPVLEVNKDHAIVKALVKKVDETGNDDFGDLAWLLLDQAKILEGETPADPAKFTQRMNRFILSGLKS